MIDQLGNAAKSLVIALCLILLPAHAHTEHTQKLVSALKALYTKINPLADNWDSIEKDLYAGLRTSPAHTSLQQACRYIARENMLSTKLFSFQQGNNGLSLAIPINATIAMQDITDLLSAYYYHETMTTPDNITISYYDGERDVACDKAMVLNDNPLPAVYTCLCTYRSEESGNCITMMNALKDLYRALNTTEDEWDFIESTGSGLFSLIGFTSTTQALLLLIRHKTKVPVSRWQSVKGELNIPYKIGLDSRYIKALLSAYHHTNSALDNGLISSIDTTCMNNDKISCLLPENIYFSADYASDKNFRNDIADIWNSEIKDA